MTYPSSTCYTDPGINLYRFDPPKKEPTWTNIPPIRKAEAPDLTTQDIESRLPKNNIYRDRDPVTNVHEQIHGLQSKIRQKHSDNHLLHSSYLLNSRAVIIQEPKYRLQRFAELMPRSLQGPLFSLYMIEQAKEWDKQPLYIFDEWNAYMGGQHVAFERGLQQRGEENLPKIFEFACYSYFVAMHCWDKMRSAEDMVLLQALTYWQTRRMFAMLLTAENKGWDTTKCREILTTFRKSLGPIQLRIFVSRFLGQQYTREWFGF